MLQSLSNAVKVSYEHVFAIMFVDVISANIIDNITKAASQKRDENEENIFNKKLNTSISYQV